MEIIKPWGNESVSCDSFLVDYTVEWLRMHFIKGKLQRGVYAFIEHQSDFVFYVENYNKMKEALTEKYGSPTVEGPLSSSSSYKELGEDKTNDTSGSKGYVKLASRWNSQNTIIRLVLSDHNYKRRFVIEYQRKKFL